MSETSRDRSVVSHSILATSANLLGLCFVMLSFIKTTGIADKTLVDESLTIPIVSFFGACLFSYLAVRANVHNSERLERWADLCFICGLVFLTILSLSLVFAIVV